VGSLVSIQEECRKLFDVSLVAVFAYFYNREYSQILLEPPKAHKGALRKAMAWK